MLTGSRAIVGTFYRTLAQSPPNSWWDKVGRRYSSDQESETYPFLGAVPPMRKWLNERQMAGLREDKVIVHNDEFEDSILVPLADLRRDKTAQHQARVRDLAARAGWMHWQKLLTDLVLAGTGSTLGTAYDGQFFFDTDHVLGSSGTLQNDIDSTDVPNLNVGTAANPNAEEAALALLGVINYMRGYADDQGEPVNEEASAFLVMCAPNLAGAFESACYDTQIVGASGAFGYNPLKARSLSLTVANNPRLTNAAAGGDAGNDDVFWVFRTDGGITPFIIQEEYSPKMAVLSEGSEFSELNNKAMFGVKASRGVGFGEWMYACRATLS